MERENGTDAAALAGGVVAIAITMFADPGPYDELGVVVALTLAALLLGYVRFNRRGRAQSAAVAAVAGILAVPMVAWVLEQWKLGLWTDCGDGRGFEPFAIMGRCEPLELGSGGLESTVSDWWAVGIWLAVAVALYAVEQFWWQPRLKRNARARAPQASPRS